MHALVDLQHGVEAVAREADQYGAGRTARLLREASDKLFKEQSFDSLYLNIVPSLLNSSLFWQEIEVATRHEEERWYIARNVSTALLLIFTFFVLYLAAITYLGWWPDGHISPLILSLGTLVDFALFSFWSFCIGRIQWSKQRAKHTYVRLALELQGITGEFLLRAASIRPQPRNTEDVLRSTAAQLQNAAQQLAVTSEQVFRQLATNNEQVLRQLVATNQNVLGNMQTLNAELERRVHLFETTPSLDGLRKDITAFLDRMSDYQGQLIRANNELNSALQRIANINEKHINVEESLTAEFEKLRNVQQATIDRTETIATAMSISAQSVVTIVDRLAHQQQLDSSIPTQQTLQRGSSGELETKSDFDVFLSYSSEDKSTVRAIAEQLKARGLLPWLDEWEMRPGIPWQRVLEEQISHIKSVAVFIGKSDTDPWQNREMRAILRDFAKRNIPVIPVLLPEYERAAPELPAFLDSTAWVDFRRKDPDPLETLAWGITGRRITP